MGGSIFLISSKGLMEYIGGKRKSESPLPIRLIMGTKQPIHVCFLDIFLNKPSFAHTKAKPGNRRGACHVRHKVRNRQSINQREITVLLQHAYNPVDWYPWGEEAFARAKAEDKPVF